MSSSDAPAPVVLHATTIAVDGRGLLIRGRSGSGKSSLALRMIALGAQLVADDRTLLSTQDGRLFADAPAKLRGLIEARTVGLLHCPATGPVRVSLVADLDAEETDRLPPERHTEVCGIRLPMVLGSGKFDQAAALMVYLRYGRYA